MSEQLSKDDYQTLDSFIRTVLERVEAGDSDPDDAHDDIMHALAAWDHGDTQEFVPWMKTMLEQWKEEIVSEEESDSED